MHRILYTLIVCILAIPNLMGKDTHYSYTQLSINEGLSQANVTSILLDQKGDLWIGTKNGLNQYAQQEMKNFFHKIMDKNSLPDNLILHLEEDSLENLWVATANGLAIYNREQNDFRTLTRGRVQSSLCIEGGVLFGGDNVLYFYNYHTKELERIHIQPEGPTIVPIEYRIQKILPFEGTKVLIGTRKKGLFTYDYQTREVKSLTKHFPVFLLFSVCIASDQCIYASFYGNGVYRFDHSGNILDSYMTKNSGLNNNYVMDMLEHKGKLWMATDGGGINMLDLQTNQISNLTHTSGNRASLPANSITKLYKDYHDNLWIGTVRGGTFSIQESYINTYQDVVMNNPSGLTEKSVSSIYEEKNGKLWIGTDGGGINLYDPSTDKFSHFPATYGDKVVSIAELSEDELLVSLYTKGIFTFNKKTGSYKNFIVVDEETNQKECFYGYLPLVSQVSDDKIYIISYGSWIYHIKEKKFAPLQLPKKSKENTSALKLAYSNHEFSLLQQGKLAFMVTQKDDSAQLLFETNANEEINSMTYDANQQTVWIGTNHGLAYYRMDEKIYRPFPTNLFNSISYLTTDQQGRLWICAENKLFSYTIGENKFTLWNASDGYLPNEIQSKFQMTRNKEFIYLSGSQGLVKIAASIESTETEEPEIYLSDVLYNGQPSLAQIQDGSFSLPWDYQSLVVTFGIKSKDVFQKHLFKFTINTPLGEHSIERYEPNLNLSALSPGKYTLSASCYAKDGSEIRPIQLLTLTVSPPWYKSTWFILLLVLTLTNIFIGTGLWMHRKKTRKMKGDVGELLQTILYSLDTKDDEMEECVPKEKESSEEPTIPVPPPTLSEADQAFLEKMDKLINDNLSNENLSIKFLMDNLAMSRASLYNKVKALTGMGVNDYINRIRIERSVYLLTQTNMSINEISYEVGFSYPRYFSTSFKQVKGMTPTRFKEESKKKGSEPI